MGASMTDYGQGQPPYAQQPPDGPPPRGWRSRRGLFGAAGAIVVAALAVGTYFLFFRGSGASAPTPRTVVKTLLDAGRANDLAAARHVLCKQDLARGVATRLEDNGRIRSYTIGPTSVTSSGVTRVAVTTTTTHGAGPGIVQIPVVKEGDSWKVCFTEEIGLSPSLSPTMSGTPTGARAPTGTPTGTAAPTTLPSGLPTGTGICTAARDGLSAAEIYVDAAQVGLSKQAQSCVYHDRVPASVTARLKGKLFGPQTTDTNATSFVFETSGGAERVTVKVARESDGHYYVTGVHPG
jgi:hypothetical protein